MKFNPYIATPLLCLLSLFAFAQKPQPQVVETNLKFKNLSLREGLSQSSVLCILQDSKGFLWFGTRDGLNRYDGNSFTIFRHDSQDTGSLSHSSIKTIFEDEKGNIWIGTINGLNRYIPAKNAFQRFYYSNAKQRSANEIWSIAPGDATHLWVGTGNGLKRLDINKGTFSGFAAAKNQRSLVSEPTRALLKTGNKLWIKSTENLGVFDTQTNKIRYYNHPEVAAKKTFKNNPATLYRDKQATIWLGSVNGLAFLDKKSNAFERFKTNKNGDGITDEVRSIREDKTGSLWIGSYNGLYVIDKEKRNFSHIVHDENDPHSLSQNSIYDIIEDSRGDIWIGTYAGGVNYYDRSYDFFRHFGAGNTATKLNYKVVSAIVEDQDQNLWIGTEGGGINFYNKQTNKFTYYTHNPNDPASLSTNNVKAIIRNKEGNLWIGTHDGGLDFLNLSRNSLTFEKYLHQSDNPQSLSNNRVISLLEDEKRSVWIGTSGGGLNVLDPGSKIITRITDPRNVVGKIIYTISSPYATDQLVVGGENGLAKLDVITQKWEAIPYFKGKGENGISRAVLSTYLDKTNNLWIGTEGDGLYAYNESTKKSVKYGIAEGLPNDIVYGILPDDQGNIWLSTNKGLSQLNLTTRRFTNYNDADGLQSNEFNYGAYAKSKSGDLLFGGANGLNRFDPSRIRGNAFVPPISITSLNVNNKPFLNVTNSTSKITLNYDQNDFSFDFVALSYSQPGKNQYAYKLEGFDQDWNYIGNKTSATYTNLDAGDYLFKVKASNDDAVWNETGLSVPLSILSAPWRTWWAYVIYALLLAVLIYVVRKFLLQRINDRNQLKQERIENERIEEVNRMKLELFTNISHDFRTPLTLIMGPLKQLISRNEGNPFVQEQHRTMHRNVNVLMELINQLLDFRKSEAGKMEVHASESNIVAFCEEVTLSFRHLAESRHIDFSVASTDENIDVWFDPIMLKKILFNLLSNAFKFTDDHGRIVVEIDRIEKVSKAMPNGYVRLKINDNGKGIPKSKISQVFDRFYHSGERFGTGIGLTLTKSLVDLHKGRITVKSSESKGTQFTIRLPLGNKHFQANQLAVSGTENDENGVYNFEGSPFTVVTASPEKLVPVFDQSRPTVLIVEDNAEIRTFLKSLFAEKYNIYDAANGSEGLEVAKNSDIDLIISDVMMPVMDGVEFCNEIKTNIRTSHIPVILLTARTSEEYQTTGYKTGADAYITKPFDADVLQIRVNNLLISRKKLIEKFKKDIILQPNEVTTSSADEDFLQKAIDIVEQNMTDADFSITTFIDEIGMSRSVFYKKLKTLTDQSISEFIRTIKLKRAAQLMEQSEMNISEIAYELGFNDAKYFRQSFKTLFKMTPSEYRQSRIG